jgi:hypothetical protein
MATPRERVQSDKRFESRITLPFIYGLLCIAGLIPVLFAVAWAVRPTLKGDITRTEIQSTGGMAGGMAYSVPISGRPPLAIIYTNLSDDISNPAQSTLILREDGSALGPAHVEHERIRSQGVGTYSHWNGSLIFSTSDNTDPRTNGRTYAIEATAQLRPAVILSGLALFLACAGLGFSYGRSRSEGSIRLAAHSVMLGAVLLMACAQTIDLYSVSGFYPLLNPDSLSYLSNSALRGVIYLGLLKASVWLVPSGVLLVPLQLSIMFFSFVAVGWSVGRLTRNSLLGWLTVLTLIADTALTRYAVLILAEPIFVAFVMFHFAAAISLLRRYSAAAATLSGVTAGLAILVRPAGYSLLLSIPFIIAIAHGQRLRALLQTASPAGALVMIGILVNFAMSGGLATHSIGGLSLLGHVLPLAKPVAKSPYPELYRQIVDVTTPLSPAARVKYPAEYWRVTSSEYYNTLLWRLALPRISAFVQNEAGQTDEHWKLAVAKSGGRSAVPPVLGDMLEDNVLATKVNKISMGLALGIIASDPLGYLRHVAAHLYGMWANLFLDYGPVSVWALGRAEEGADIAKWRMVKEYFTRTGYPADRIRLQLIKNSDPVKVSDALWSWIRPFLRLLLPIMPLLTLVAAGTMFFNWLKRRTPPSLLAGLAFCSLHMWAYFGLVATVNSAVDRYSVVFEPVLITFLAIGGASLIGWASNWTSFLRYAEIRAQQNCRRGNRERDSTNVV